MPNLSIDPLEFQRDGFTIVRNVFDSVEVARMRSFGERFARESKDLGRILRSKTGEVVPVGDLLGREGIDVVFDERLLRIARALLGKQELVYFGDSGLMLAGSLRGFHKDNAVADDPTHVDWRSPYTLLRIAIYLEDHVRNSGGVKVRRGSHMHVDVTTGEIVDVPTGAGDVVVWSLRTTHSGHFVRVRGLPWLHLQPRFEGRLPGALAVAEACERVALFVTYGLQGEHLDAYIRKHTDLASYPDNYLYKSWLFSSPDARFDEIAAARGCKLVRPTADWGRCFGSREPENLGYVPTLPCRPDRYGAPRGAEWAIQTLGRLVRKVGGARVNAVERTG